MQLSNVVQIPILNENKEEMDNYIIFSHPFMERFFYGELKVMIYN